MAMTTHSGTGGGGGTRAAKKRATRDALIDAAYAEISEHGPNRPSLDAICARAGKTRGAFYVHFRDREQLLIAVMDRVLGDFLRAMAGAGRGAGDPLRAGVRTFTGAAAAGSPAVHPDRALRFHHLLEACRDSAAIGARYRSILAGATDWAESAVATEQRTGRARNDVTAAAAADLLLATGLGLLAMLELGIAPDPVALGDTALALLSPPPAPRRTRRS